MKRGKGAGLNERARYTNDFVSARMNDKSIDSWQYLISIQSGKRQWNNLGNQMCTSAPIVKRDSDRGRKATRRSSKRPALAMASESDSVVTARPHADDDHR
jgi:hypothetical protein